VEIGYLVEDCCDASHEICAPLAEVACAAVARPKDPHEAYDRAAQRGAEKTWSTYHFHHAVERYARLGLLIVDRLIETVPQGDWPAGDGGNVDALLTEHHRADHAANEPNAYRAEDVRLHRFLLARPSHGSSTEPK
jgi:hypothetical protein